jgi:hypothetical protein
MENRQKTYKKPKSEGCHCANPKPDGTCCNLVCFERPNYFCGHLLTDADLSKEQQYVVEKHKLYNRTLHGWGIVCGLRLTCGDQECCGSIVIDEGYAIDDCGNDLVVCEPLRFDVVSLLKEKGWVVGDAAYDPCAPDDEDDDCEYTQCFYVTVCYEEEPRDFTTPFVAGCRPTLTECEPTRIREGVRFDVLDKLPHENEWLKDLIKRLSCCFSIFTDGPFARALEQNKRELEDICKDPQQIEGSRYDDLNKRFCELRGLLLLYLQKHPDKYNCKFADEIRRNTLPDPNTPDFGEQVKESFSSILRLAFQYAISCALGELVPRCPEPEKAGCVVLGTVEVKGGCVTHVCNCPRKYVWSFANFFQVLLATMYGSLACEGKEEMRALDPAIVRGQQELEQEPKRHVCCREFDASCEEIVALLNINPKFLEYAGTEAVRAFDAMAKSFRKVFNFTDASMYSPAMLRDLDQNQLRRAVNYLGIEHGNIRYEEQAVAEAPVHPFEEFARIGLARLRAPDTTLVFERDRHNVVQNAYAVPSSLPAEGTRKLEAQIKEARAEANAANKLAQDLRRQLEDFIRGQKSSTVSERVNEVLKSIPETAEPARQPAKKRSSKQRPPQTPGTEGGQNG